MNYLVQTKHARKVNSAEHTVRLQFAMTEKAVCLHAVIVRQII